MSTSYAVGVAPTFGVNRAEPDAGERQVQRSRDSGIVNTDWVNHVSAEPLATVQRSGVVESVHLGHACVLDADGKTVVSIGDPSTTIPGRSALKPAQARGSLNAGAVLSRPQIAIASGSHTGELRHQELVRSILQQHGLTDDHLQCVADWPEHELTRLQAIRDGQSKTRIAMNCSGKHAAMLSACVVNGWSVADYLDPAHPVQTSILDSIAELADEADLSVAIDGCGAPVAVLSVSGLARMAQRISQDQSVADAMREAPWAVGGEGHQNTTAMEQVPGLIAKGGAEGVIVLATADGIACAVKVIDGSPRATTLIGLHLLASVGVDVTSAVERSQAPVLGGGIEVGKIVVSDRVVKQ